LPEHRPGRSTGSWSKLEILVFWTGYALINGIYPEKLGFAFGFVFLIFWVWFWVLVWVVSRSIENFRKAYYKHKKIV